MVAHNVQEYIVDYRPAVAKRISYGYGLLVSLLCSCAYYIYYVIVLSNPVAFILLLPFIFWTHDTINKINDLKRHQLHICSVIEYYESLYGIRS